MLIFSRYLSFFFFSGILLSSCKKDPVIYDLPGSNFPKEPGKILLTRCANEGCHTKTGNSGGLSLETWDDLFRGNKRGAVVIPYNPEQSPLFQFSNIYPELGPEAKPSMPLNQEPLSKKEVEILKNWILVGAPDSKGFVKFSNDPVRKKYYVTNQGCDLISVIDQESGLIMRMIEAGQTPGIESPHLIKIAPNGMYWYVIFMNGNLIQKYSTRDDSFIGQIILDDGLWNTFVITENSKFAYCVDWQANGKVFFLDLEKLSIVKKYQGNNLFNFPHGIGKAVNSNFVYVTGQSGNLLYKIDVLDPLSPDIEEIDLGPLTNGQNSEPHEILFSKDGSEYYVTCQRTNELRVYSALNDSLLNIIPTGNYPQEMALSSNGILGVTCTEGSYPGKIDKGSVTFIDTQKKTLIANTFTGGQPHGIAIDESTNAALVTLRNLNPDGPTPHHVSDCAGNNGFLLSIDLSSFQVIEGSMMEMSVDPYSVTVRF